jgi:hypothetical protein
MASILADCTNCGGQNVGFEIAAEHLTPGGGDWFTLLFCGKCRSGLMVSFRRNLNNYNSPMKCPGDPTDGGHYTLLARYPQPQPSQAPDHLPKAIADYFLEAADNFKRAAYTSSGFMSRKVIEVSTKRQLGEEAKNYRDNRQRIDALAASGAITGDLQDWAHHVRLGGNEAVHEDVPFDKDQAQDLLSFTELYLTYVYSLPGRLRVRRGLPALEETPPPA